MRRSVAVLAVAAFVGLGGTACTSSNDDSGATTNLDEIGPQISKLRLEVSRLRAEVRDLEQQILLLTPETTTPEATPETPGTTPPEATSSE